MPFQALVSVAFSAVPLFSRSLYGDQIQSLQQRGRHRRVLTTAHRFPTVLYYAMRKVLRQPPDIMYANDRSLKRARNMHFLHKHRGSPQKASSNPKLKSKIQRSRSKTCRPNLCKPIHAIHDSPDADHYFLFLKHATPLHCICAALFALHSFFARHSLCLVVPCSLLLLINESIEIRPITPDAASSSAKLREDPAYCTYVATKA